MRERFGGKKLATVVTAFEALSPQKKMTSKNSKRLFRTEVEDPSG